MFPEPEGSGLNPGSTIEEACVLGGSVSSSVTAPRAGAEME